MVDPEVRSASTDDVTSLSDLELEARHALIDSRGGTRWLETHRSHSWSDLIADGAALVAVLDDVPVGYLALAFDDHASVATVVDVFVTSGARELGFGDALLAAGIDLARGRGSTWIEGEALPGDRDTKNLYERARITARLIVVSRRL